jgi:hypothetical protein
MAVGRRILPAAQAQIVDSAGRSTPQFYDFFRRLLDELAELRRAVEQLQGIHPPAVPDLSQYTRRGANESITGQWSFYDSIWGADGSEPEPQYTFINDPDLGFYRVDDDNLGISVGGVLRWDIDDTRTFQSVMLQARIDDGYIARFENLNDPDAGLRVFTEYGELGSDTFLDFHETDVRYFRLGNRGEPANNAHFELSRFGSTAAIDGTIFTVARESKGIDFLEQVRLVPGTTDFALSFTGYTHAGLFGDVTGNSDTLRWSATTTTGSETSGAYIEVQQLSNNRRAGFRIRNPAGDSVWSVQRMQSSFANVVRTFLGVDWQVASNSGTQFWVWDGTAGHFTASDSVQLRLGAGGDLRLFHDGTANFIQTLGCDLSVYSDGLEVLRIPSGSSPRLQAINGTAALPTYSFFNDTNTGMYRVGTDQLGFATGGTLRLTIDGSTSITSTLPLRGPNGSAAAPAVSFSVDSDTGIYRAGENHLALAAGAARIVSASLGPASGGTSRTVTIGDGTAVSQLNLDSNAATNREIVFLTSGSQRWIIRANSSAETGSDLGSNLDLIRRADDGSNLAVAVRIHRSTGQWLFEDGSASLPELSFFSDTDTGIFRVGANRLGFAAGGTQRAEIGSKLFVGLNQADEDGVTDLGAATVSAAFNNVIDIDRAGGVPFVRMNRLQGSYASPSAVSSGLVVLQLAGRGYNGSSFNTGIEIRATSTETYSPTAGGTQLEIRLADNGTTVVREVARFTAGGAFALIDGVTAPAANITGMAQIYIDSADGDLKIRFSDGTVKTIVTDT